MSKMKNIVINIAPIKEKKSSTLEDEKDIVLKALYADVEKARNKILVDNHNISLKKFLFGLSTIVVSIVIVAINIVQAILYSGTITPSLISSIVYFNIAMIIISTFGGGTEMFSIYQQNDVDFQKNAQAINTYERLLNSIEKVSLTDRDKRDPAKIKRIKDRFVDTKMHNKS